VSGQFHVLAALSMGEESLLLLDKKLGGPQARLVVVVKKNIKRHISIKMQIQSAFAKTVCN
jgi:hypothetical protein